MGIRSRLLGGGDASIARARRPEALRLTLAAPPAEGLDWLGRVPGPRAPGLYRLLVHSGRALLLGLCALRVDVEGRDGLPKGGYIAACALHRSWIDPLLVIQAIPVEPRPWFLGSGPTAFDRRWKERLLRRTGGMLPVWRGGHDVDIHVRAGRAVVESGAVLALFMEGAVGGPPDHTARIRAGTGLLALRTGAPIVPVAICGAEELYRGKRISVRILPATTVRDLLGADVPPDLAPGGRAELDAARRVSEALADRITRVVGKSHPATLDGPDRPRRWVWLTRLFR
jgi:1-acyl-sn-glycerol-3-phosphate acyltransferase